MNAERPAILLVGDTLNSGGTERQFVEVASRLDRSRWDVHVSCLKAEGPLPGIGQLIIAVLSKAH